MPQITAPLPNCAAKKSSKDSESSTNDDHACTLRVNQALWQGASPILQTGGTRNTALGGPWTPAVSPPQQS